LKNLFSNGYDKTLSPYYVAIYVDIGALNSIDSEQFFKTVAVEKRSRAREI